MRRIKAVAAVLALAGATLWTAASSAGAAPAEGPRAAVACPTGWGSGAKSGAATGADHLEDIRTGQHECYDRIVFEVPGGGDRIGYQVQYVDRFHADPSGAYIPVAGGAILDIRVGAWSYDLEAGAPTYPGKVGEALPGVNVGGYSTFRDTRFGGTFEGQTQVGLGVRARLPFRVIQLDDRIVVDVAHSWTS
ncbi:AMIN-like domain-containing (lipo)protein [Streptomyces olivaceoviridis]|uniref:AMIN-like domain-containing (lipo)protein n=1 Tax=Streptomyces olivaceoviridis TaxID=1921 RepID=UPI0036BA2883